MKRHDIFMFDGIESVENLVAMRNPSKSLNPGAYVTPPVSVLTSTEMLESKWVVKIQGKTPWLDIDFVIARRLTSDELVYFFVNEGYSLSAKTRLLFDVMPIIDDSRLFEPISPGHELIPQQWIEELFKSMYASGGVGLAANQIGYSQRIFVMDVPGCSANIGDRPRVYFNPVITHPEGKLILKEGCVSLPGKMVAVERAEVVYVNGDRLEGTEARVAQHEIDHLNGITLLDYELRGQNVS